MKSVLFIDIEAESVAGAYAHYAEDETPVLLYTRRLPIEIRKDEPNEQALLRALSILGNELIREGAPMLLRAAGSGSAGAILVSVDAPWQETNVRTEHFEREHAFALTKNMVATALQKSIPAAPGKIVTDESIIGTILNGYETCNPYGRKARHALVIVLASLIDARVADSVRSTLRGLFHTTHIALIASCSLRYQAMRIAFPHEREALILDAIGSSIFLTLIRRGLFTALTDVSRVPDDRARTEKIMSGFATLAESSLFPRTIFSLTRESDASFLSPMFEAENFKKLWFSNNAPKIVPVLASHLVGLVRQATATPPDLQLFLMALYYQHMLYFTYAYLE